MSTATSTEKGEALSLVSHYFTLFGQLEQLLREAHERVVAVERLAELERLVAGDDEPRFLEVFYKLGAAGDEQLAELGRRLGAFQADLKGFDVEFDLRSLLERAGRVRDRLEDVRDALVGELDV